MTEHPVIKWAMIGITVVAFLAGVIAYAQSLRGQVGDVNLILSEVEQRQRDQFDYINVRFEELETGQLGLRASIATSQDDLNFRIGVLHGWLAGNQAETFLESNPASNGKGG